MQIDVVKKKKCYSQFFAQLYLTLTRQEMEGKSREYRDRDFTTLGSRQNCCFSLWVCFCNPTLSLVRDHTSPAITLHLYSMCTYLIHPENRHYERRMLMSLLLKMCAKQKKYRHLILKD